MARASGLGKGLGSLIPSELQPQSVVGIDTIPVADVQPNPYQPRKHFDEEALSSLSDSIRELGVLQPILVRPSGKGFEIIAGERRWRAAKRVGLTSIPALVREVDDTISLEQSIVENVQRSDLNPLEEAAAYQQLIEDFKLTHDQVAKRVGRSRTSITNTLRLLVLPPSIQKWFVIASFRWGMLAHYWDHPTASTKKRLQSKQLQKHGLFVQWKKQFVLFQKTKSI